MSKNILQKLDVAMNSIEELMDVLEELHTDLVAMNEEMEINLNEN